MIPKAKIIRVGKIATDYDGAPILTGWHFDGDGMGIPFHQVIDGIYYVCGWSVRDLREVMQRPSEFVELEEA